MSADVVNIEDARRARSQRRAVYLVMAVAFVVGFWLSNREGAAA